MRTIEAGYVVAGRYRLLASIGAGSMGVVWRALDQLLRVEVAVKAVWVGGRPAAAGPGPGGTDRELVAAAVREARNAAQLRGNPHVVSVADVVEDAGLPWIVMELVAATSLETAVRASGPLPTDRVAEIGLAVLDALLAGQRIGLLHRDVKPSNILLAEDGRILLTDFGLATHVADTTSPGSDGSAGTPAYLAPERIRQRPASLAADLFSLGATLYFAVDGASPFVRENIALTLSAVLRVDPQPLERADALWPVIGGLLTKDPAARLGGEAARALLLRVRRLNTTDPAPSGPRPSVPAARVSPPVPEARSAPAPGSVPAPRSDTALPISETPVLETPISETPVLETPISETPVLDVPIPEAANSDLLVPALADVDLPEAAGPGRGGGPGWWWPRRPLALGGIAAVALVLLGVGLLWATRDGSAGRGPLLPAGMTGAWSGSVRQGPIEFVAEIELRDGGVGQIVGRGNYPADGCVADLRLLETGGNRITVQERLIRSGALCRGADRLVLELLPDGRLSYTFAATAINSVGHGVLTRA